MEGLGRLFDIGTGWAPVDLDTANAATGKRISLSGASGITFVVSAAAGGATALEFDVQQHTAASGGTTADLDVVDHYYIKSETALDNDEPWVRVDQVAASEVSLPTTDGDNEYIVAIEVSAKTLGTTANPDGFTHVSLNAAGTLAAAKIAGCLYILHGLKAERAPASLGNLLNPGAANA